jgi:hypothetical protein
MRFARWLFTLLAILAAGAGCAPPIITARFPDLAAPQALKPNATQVGLAPVADSRRDESAGWDANGIPVVAGPALTGYIQHKFHNQMMGEGFAPADAPDPAGGGANLPPYKTIVITLQSTNYGNSGSYMTHEIASTDIAVQVFAPSSRTIVFAQSYLGTHRENGDPGAQLAAAANGAIDAAFADQAFLKALQ